MQILKKIVLAAAVLTVKTLLLGQSAPSGEASSHANPTGLMGRWTGPGGRPLYFTGQGGVQVPSSSNLDLPNGSPWTLAAWIDPSSQEGMHVAGKREGCTSGDGFYILAIDRNAPGTGMSVDPADTPIGVWTHVAISADGIRGWISYVNGVAVKTVSQFGWKIQNSGAFIIGGAGTCAPFKGQIAEVSLYDRALSPVEVQAAYRRGLHDLPMVRADALESQVAPIRVSAAEADKLLISRPAVHFSPFAVQVRAQGIVKVEFTVTARGAVKDAVILSGQYPLNANALDCVLNSKYRPYLVNGRPVPIRTTTDLVYKLTR